MARKKKSGLVGAVQTRFTTWIASILAMATTSATAWFWNDIVGRVPIAVVSRQETPSTVSTPPSTPIAPPFQPLIAAKTVVAEVTSHRRREPTFSCDLLGCRVTGTASKVYVAEVPPGSVAAILGLKHEDLICSVDAHDIFSPSDLEVRLARCDGFFPSSITILRGDRYFRGKISLVSGNQLKVKSALLPN